MKFQLSLFDERAVRNFGKVRILRTSNASKSRMLLVLKGRKFQSMTVACNALNSEIETPVALCSGDPLNKGALCDDRTAHELHSRSTHCALDANAIAIEFNQSL